jgi:hypothetical protein
MKLSSRNWTFWVKAAQAAALVVAICFTLGATSAPERRDKLSHRLTCTCGGCSQLLGECDHAGCSGRDEEFRDLNIAIANGSTDKEILAAFSTKYGATVLAAPTTKGFDLVAWIAPVAVFLAALFGVILVARHWATTRPQTAAAQSETPEMAAIREKIRRETGADGGF